MAVTVGEGLADLSSALKGGCTHCQTTAWQGENPCVSFFTPISCHSLLLAEPSEKLKGKGNLLEYRAGWKRVELIWRDTQK